jgi:type IV conjugative transfer system protein TraL
MQMRPVPRNIDRPNRIPELVMSYLAVHFSIMFLTQKALIAITLGMLAVYLMYKITLDKPEGIAMRVIYRYLQLGKMRPTPTRCRKLEV